MDILGRRRLWIDNRNFPGRRGLRPEFVAGVSEFIAKARTTDDFIWHGKIRCPCVRCKCVTIQDLPNVEIHLYEKGFMPNYYIWVNHGETRDLQDRINDLKMIHGGRSSPVVDRSSQQSEEGSSTPTPLTVDDETRIWLEVTGGVKKGSAYGMGTLYASETAQSSYLGSTIPAPSISADPAEMARMKAEIADLKQQNEVMRKENKDHQTKMEKMMEKLLGRSEKRKKKKERKENSSRKSKKKHKRRQSSLSESDAESSSG